MNEDFLDMLSALVEEAVDFMVVGAYALAAHDIPRATGDVDIWIRPTPENAERAWRALEKFGAPLETLHVSVTDLQRQDVVIQLGLPPRRIDLMTSITGVDFETAAQTLIYRTIDSLEVPFIGREALLQNKRSTGRLKDLVDVESLERNIE
ncbi:MAG: hypothetical protein WD273_02370 [Trueperaceae bacterium]